MNVVCTSIAGELVAYLDGEQSEPDRTRIEEHLASCLTCRREMDRLTKVGAWLQALPRIEPQGDLAERMRLRLEREVGDPPRSWRRAARWAAPALAAAAVGVFMLYSTLTEISPERHGKLEPGRRSTVARQDEDGAGSSHSLASGKVAAPGPVLVREAQPKPEDLPPELVEHPELFLRLPVVRRLNKLEHFEEVRRHGEPDDLGSADGWPRAAG